MHAHNSNIAPQHMFDSVTLGDGMSSSTGIPSRQMRQPSPSAVDRQLESSPTFESLLALNTTLKTRVSELEFVNELFRGRVTELEQSDASARRSEMIVRDSEVRLRRSLEDAQRREEDLKRRVCDLERQVGSSSAGEADSGEPLAKKIRLSDVVETADEASAKSPKSV